MRFQVAYTSLAVSEKDGSYVKDLLRTPADIQAQKDFRAGKHLPKNTRLRILAEKEAK